MYKRFKMDIDLELSNPKTFLPLLLFIGFVLVLLGTILNYGSGMVLFGVVLIIIAIVLFVIKEFVIGD